MIDWSYYAKNYIWQLKLSQNNRKICMIQAKIERIADLILKELEDNISAIWGGEKMEDTLKAAMLSERAELMQRR